MYPSRFFFFVHLPSLPVPSPLVHRPSSIVPHPSSFIPRLSSFASRPSSFQSLLHQVNVSHIGYQRLDMGGYSFKSQSLLHQVNHSHAAPKQIMQKAIIFRRNPFYIRSIIHTESMNFAAIMSLPSQSLLHQVNHSHR